MKTKQQIDDAFCACLRAALALDGSEDPIHADAMRHFARYAGLLAWVLDERSFPGFAAADRMLTRVMQSDDQLCAKMDAGGG